MATGLINLLATVLALPLVDRLGRRKLMLIGAGGLTLLCTDCRCYTLGITGWPVLILVLAAIAVYALTLAPVTAAGGNFPQPDSRSGDVGRHAGAVDCLFCTDLYLSHPQCRTCSGALCCMA